MLFGKSRPSITPQQRLAARPQRMVEVELLPRKDGGANLKVQFQPRKWLGRILAMPQKVSKTFELDELGLFVWEQCDGKTSVKQIATRLSKKYNLSLREAQVATEKFLEMLTRKGLLGFEVKSEPS